MKRAYIAVPAFLTIGFAAYFAVWKTHAKNRAEEERRQAIEDAYGGKLYRNRNGKKEAEDDIAQGKPKLKEFGLMPAETLEWREVLKECFQVEAESIAGCIVSEPLLKYAHAYNDVAVSYIKKRYGPTALDDARQEARRRFDKRHERVANDAPEPTALAVTPRAEHEGAPDGARGSP